MPHPQCHDRAYKGSPFCAVQAFGRAMPQISSTWHSAAVTLAQVTHAALPDLARTQVAGDAEQLRGGLRFVAALFKAHLLPAALVRCLAGDLAAHTAAGPAQRLHCQPLLAAALVALLQVGASCKCSRYRKSRGP